MRGVFPATGEDDGDIPRFQLGLGDLADPGAAGGTAIAWKAPKAGTVKVTLGRDNEPQRRNANASGTVTLALTKNGETLCTADISTAQTKNDDFVNCLKSDKGFFFLDL